MNISADFFKSSTYELKHADVVFIRQDAKKKPQEIVYLGGEFCFPGHYAKIDENESVLNLITRAGGFKESAYLEGVTFKRSKDSIGQVGIDFYNLIVKNKLKENIVLEHGDSIIAPTLPKTVNISGSVNNKTATKYVERKSVGHYINRAGGLTLLGKRGTIYVVRANGEVRQVSLRDRNAINAGSQVFATDGPPPRERSPQAVITALSGLAATMMAFTTIYMNLTGKDKQ
jgi:protein involved in polysaccharide export with SLBB domain